MDLDGVHREEKEFLKKLKEKLSTRYDKLKQSIERDYEVTDQRK
jgi:lysine/ornithine N-monooxygenase